MLLKKFMYIFNLKKLLCDFGLTRKVSVNEPSPFPDAFPFLIVYDWPCNVDIPCDFPQLQINHIDTNLDCL